jgi:hypothetical protein
MTEIDEKIVDGALRAGKIMNKGFTRIAMRAALLDAAPALIAAERERCEKIERKYDALFDWISWQISHTEYVADEIGEGLPAWERLADMMHNGTMASFRLDGYYDRNISAGETEK